MKQLLAIAMLAICLAACKKDETLHDCSATGESDFTVSQTDSTFRIRFTGEIHFTNPTWISIYFNDTSQGNYQYPNIPSILLPDTTYIFEKKKLVSGPTVILPFIIDSLGFTWYAASATCNVKDDRNVVWLKF